MVIKQISVFVENKEGRIKKALDTLTENNINIKALSIADTSKYGILRLIVSDNEKAIESLENDGFVVRENDVIILSISDEPNGLNSILEILDKNEINLEYLFAFSTNASNKAIVVMRLENINEAIDILKENNAELLEKEDIEKL